MFWWPKEEDSECDIRDPGPPPDDCPDVSYGTQQALVVPLEKEQYDKEIDLYFRLSTPRIGDSINLFGNGKIDFSKVKLYRLANRYGDDLVFKVEDKHVHRNILDLIDFYTGEHMTLNFFDMMTMVKWGLIIERKKS